MLHSVRFLKIHILLFVCFFCLQTFGESGGFLDGWTPHLSELDNLPQQNSYVFIIALSSRSPISYASANDLKNSLIWNDNSGSSNEEAEKRFRGVEFETADKYKGKKLGFLDTPKSVGHFMVAWRCSFEGKHKKGMTAFGGENSNQTQKMLDRGFGLSSLFATYTDGFFFEPKPKKGRSDFFGLYFFRANKAKNPKAYMDMKWMGFQVSLEDCDRAIEFVNYFYQTGDKRAKETQAQKTKESQSQSPIFHFGFNFDPHKFNGAGCSSFGKAFLEFANVFQRTARHWVRTIHIPSSLLGYPSKDLLPKDTLFPLTPQHPSLRAKNPSFESLLGTSQSQFQLFSRSWAYPKEDEESFRLDIVDLELVYYTIGELERLVTKKTTLNMTGFNLKPRFEKRFVTIDPNPYTVDRDGEEYTDIEYFKIDRHLDKHTQRINESLLQNTFFSSQKFTISEINGVKGLVINR